MQTTATAPRSNGKEADQATLFEFMKASTKAASEDELLSDLALAVRNAMGADAADILLRDGNDGLVLRASTAAPEFNIRVRLGKGVGVCGHAQKLAEPIFIRKGAERDPRWAKCPGIDDQPTEGIAVLPLKHDEVFGIVLLRRHEPWPFTGAQKRRAIDLANALSAAITGFQHAYSLGTQINRLGALSEVSKTIATSPYLEEILQLLVNLTAQQFNYKVCTVRLLDERRGELVLRATQAPAKAYQRKRAIHLGESIAGRAIAENQPIIVRDVTVEADYIGHDLAVEQGLRSMICVPLTIQDRAVGVLSCYTSEVREFPPDEVKALETLAKQAAVSIEHAKLQVRSTLMQEMHHRVKNNLQQVASLLRLQMRHSGYKSLEEALNDCLSRILAIAAVHDLLSREDLDHVDLRTIAEALVQHQQHSFMLPDRSIEFKVRGDDVVLTMTQATQVALVLNELIQNAIEHGFAKTARGEVHITVEEREGEVSLWVSDSGDPLPPGFDLSSSSHLGLQIVESLSRALGGRFKLSDILGWTVAEVKFPRAGSE
jgi:two-component system, sensor histidine kinase PdtaS